MPSPRLLVIEGNSPDSIAQHVAVGGTPAHQGYSNLLRELLPGAAVDSAHPGEVDRHVARPARRSKAMTASPSPARRCTSITAARR